MKTRRAVLLDWILLITFCIFLFSTSNILPAVWGKIRSLLGGRIEYLPEILVGSIPFFLLFYAIFIRRQRYILCYVWFIILALLLLIVYTEIKRPWDKMHLAGYFIISFLFFRVLYHYIFSVKLYLLGVIFSMLIAVIDETAQLFITYRTFSLADLKADFAAVLLGELSIVLIVRPRLERWRFKLKLRRAHLRAEKRWLSRRKDEGK